MVPWFFVEVDRVKSVTKTQMMPNNRKINASFSGELNFFIQQKYGSGNKIVFRLFPETTVAVSIVVGKTVGLALGHFGNNGYKLVHIQPVVYALRAEYRRWYTQTSCYRK